MKPIVLLIAFFCSTLMTAQNFSKEWKEIYQLEKEGSYKTLKTNVDALYRKAHKNKNEVQVLKTFFYRQKFAKEIGTSVPDVDQIKLEIGSVSEATKLFYYLIEATELHNEMLKNPYGISRRVQTTVPLTEKSKTEWTKADYLSQLKRLQTLTFANSSILFQSIKPYEEVILIKDGQNGLFENYFEFFAMEWIHIYHSLESYGLTTTLEELNISTKVLDLSDNFYQTDFTENGLQAVKLYQQLEEYYLLKNSSYFFDKVRYNRLKNYGYKSEKDTRILLYDYFLQSAKTKEFIDKSWFDLATLFVQERTEKGFAKADELLTILLEKNPEEFVKNDAIKLKNEIHRKTIKLTAPSYAHSEERIKMLANYRNVDSLYNALYLIEDEDVFNSVEHPLDFDIYRKNNFAKEVVIFFPMRNFQKYIENSTEVFIPKQPQGNYILAYHSQDFIKDDAVDSVQFVKFKVTNTVVVSKIKERELEFSLYDRNSGKSLKNSKVRIDGKRYITDNKGSVRKKKRALPKKMNSFDQTELKIAIDDDYYKHTETFSFRNFQYYYDKESFKEDEEVEVVLKLFTDRGLYRPGHEVHFKGMVFNQYEYKTANTVENIRLNLVVKDASNNKIYNSDVVTNEWGSFSGSFKIPLNASLGSFRIHLEEPDDLSESEEEFWENIDFYDDELVFWVEEYKRPTFEVQTDNFSESLLPNQTFQLSGKAISFAKTPIANAKVTAKITVSKAYEKLSSEKINLPEFTTNTKADGTFEIPFQMNLSTKDSITNKPYHTYSFEIDVQDTTGEVRSTVANVYYSYNDLSIRINSSATLNKKADFSIELSAETANGKPAKAKGTLKVLLVHDYETYRKKRLWQAPKHQLLNEATFKMFFPYEQFITKDWKEKEEVFQKEIDFEGITEIILPTKDWKIGYYEIVFKPDATHQYNFPIKRGLTYQIPEEYKDNESIVHLSVDKEKSKSRNNLVFRSLSEFDSVYVNIELRDATGKFTQKQVEINKGTSFVVLEEIEYSKVNLPLDIQYYYVYDNRFYQQTTTIPYSVAAHNNWTVHTEKINNKLTPSQSYHWKFKVTSDTNSPFQGEVLATMYDTSIDRLTNENLSEWDFRNLHYISSRFDLPEIHFDENINYARVNYSDINYIPINFKSHILFNTLNWFGYGDYERQKEYDNFIDSQLKNELKEGFVSSKVVDGDFGDFLPNVKVTNQSTGQISYSDVKGGFVIEAKPMDEIIFEMEGMKSYKTFAQNISIARGLITLQTLENELILEEIVVDSYRTVIESRPNDPILIYDVQTKDERIDYVNNLKQMFSGLDISKSAKTLEGYSSITLMSTQEIAPLLIVDGIPVSLNRLDLNEVDITQIVVYKDAGAMAIYGNRGANGAVLITTKKSADLHKGIILRKNLQEMAFFFPHLNTDEEGVFEVNFKAPESLTEWRFRALGHNSESEFAYFDYKVNTQKDVMIQPNMPRFVRETDEVVLKARVSNTTNQPLNATAMLRLFNTITGEDLTEQIIKTEALAPVTIEGLSANTVSWTVQIPKNIEGLQYRISVQSGNFTDGEESVIPVLSNRQLITETLPIWQLANENKSYQLTNLIENESKTLENHQLKIEVSNNATWLMMQSLPYLFDYPHQCSEQLFAKYFANVIASNVLENSPSIQQLVKEWKENPKSKLEENEELKQILLQETPWMKDLVSNEEQKAQFAHYFDVNRLDDEAEKIEDILTERQLPSGALPWFSGGIENRYITEHILVTAAQLKNLGINNPLLNNKEGLINKAHRYLDVQFEKKFQNKQEASFSEVIDYAFVKSYYKDSFAVSKENQAKINLKLTELKKDWVKLSLYDKARLALITHRKGDTDWAKQIINQLEESSVIDEIYGMYWKENSNKNYYYYNAAEVQALLIEAYKETEMSQDKIQRLNAWLLSQKLQTNWGTTKSTTQSLYAFLLSQQDTRPEKGSIQIQVGNEKLDTGKATETEQQIGIYAYQWTGDDVKNEMGKVEVKNTTSQPVFGGIYWQYFEDMSAVKPSENSLLNISRNYYIEDNDNKWDLVTAETQLTLGQKVKVRIEVEAVRDMSFVHIKDVRPATFEPVDVLSGYHYKNGLGYYQSTRDAATHFFVDTLNKGKYVLEYEVRLNNIGTFISGISTIKSMYAPEHSGHSSGKSVKVQ